MAMHTELWFPSVVWSSIIHVVDNTNLKAWAYEKKRTDKGVRFSNYGGWQSSSITYGECLEIDNLVDLLNDEVKLCCQQVGLRPLELYNIWININGTGNYNMLHHHVDSVLSGVYYVDAEPNQGNINFERGDGAEYHLPVEVDKLTYFNTSKTTYQSKTNALYIFPSWLKHSVEGNRTTKDRISVSFNYGEKK